MKHLSLLLICLVAILGNTQAQLTGLDSTFNHVGSAVHNGSIKFSTYRLTLQDLTVQPDGSVIYVGSKSGSFGAHFVHFREDGSLDSSFGVWRQRLYLYGLDHQSMRLRSLDDGRFLLLGKTSDDSTILFRLLPTGYIDNSFGSYGKKKYELKQTPFNIAPECLAVQPNGKIIMGVYSNGIPKLLRIENDGKIDSTFGQHGYVILDYIGGLGYRINDILFTNTRILCAGANRTLNGDRYGVQALKYNGEPDSTFGTNGTTVVDIGWKAEIKGCGLQRDDKIILGGVGAYYNTTLLRLTSNGIVDSTFGTTGNGKELSYDRQIVGGVNVDGNDVIWVTAARHNYKNHLLPLYEPYLVRYAKNGKIDSTYKTNGRVPFTLTSDTISYMRTKIVKDKLHIFGGGTWGNDHQEYVARLYLRPILNLYDSVSYCDYDTATIIGKNHLPHKWYRNDTLLAHTGDTLKTRIPGTYKLVLTDSAASDTSHEVFLTFKPPVAKPILTGLDTLCVGDTLSLLASSSTQDVTWSWFDPSGKLTNTDSVITVDSVTNADTGLYRVAAMLDGCTSEEDSLTLRVYPVVKPSVTVTPDKINTGPWVDILFSTSGITNDGSKPVYQWTKNGADIPGANALTYTGTTAIDLQTGDVICFKLSSSMVCARPYTVNDCDTVNINLGVEPIVIAEEFDIYPNPSSGIFTLKLNNASFNKAMVKVYDVLGRICYQSPVVSRQTQIKLNEPKGTYVVKLQIGDKVSVKRIVVE